MEAAETDTRLTAEEAEYAEGEERKGKYEREKNLTQGHQGTNAR